jgi:short-subunit dehydrogenase
MNMHTSDKRPLALITGASGGIGLELARQFAAGGHDLVLVARSASKLEAAAGELEAEHHIHARVLTADLLDPAATERVHREVGDEVDVLVNNAGFAHFGEFATVDRQETLDTIRLNVMALVDLTRLFLPAMVARKAGRILNVASTAGFQPGPLMAVYYATKAFVLSFSEAIADELAGTGVTVTALCPGPTQSGFQARARMEDSKLVRGKAIMSSEEVAKVGYRGMMKGKRVVIPGTMNKLIAQSVRFFPRKTITRVVHKMQERAPQT